MAAARSNSAVMIGQRSPETPGQPFTTLQLVRDHDDEHPQRISGVTAVSLLALPSQNDEPANVVEAIPVAGQPRRLTVIGFGLQLLDGTPVLTCAWRSGGAPVEREVTVPFGASVTQLVRTAWARIWAAPSVRCA